MITSITTVHEGERKGIKTLQQLNHTLLLIAAAYSDDPGTSDLDDEQPVHPVTALTLGDVRLARRLVRTGCVTTEYGRNPIGTVNDAHVFPKSGDTSTCIECGAMLPAEMLELA